MIALALNTIYSSNYLTLFAYQILRAMKSLNDSEWKKKSQFKTIRLKIGEYQNCLHRN